MDTRVKNLLRWLIALGATATVLTAATERPNIVHIMADDLGWRDLSVYGSESFHTPNIDRLAERGMLFSNGYAASPLCSPTRAATLTGQTVGRIRITTPTGHLPQVILDPVETPTSTPGMPMTNPQNRSRLPLDSVTLSQILKDNGYATAFMGKWHLGHDPFIPENFGFDKVVGGRGTPGPPQSRFFGPWDPEKDNVPQVEGSPNIDDVLGDQAVKWIAEKKDQPFFLALWLYNPHAPFEGKPDDIEAAREQAEMGLYQQSAIMASMVKTIDDNVGKVMDALEAQGLLENTLVIFTSDNGGNMYDRPEGFNPTNNHPLRAGKGNNYEGGSRVPLIACWPTVVPKGSTSETICISYDWFPTFLDMAGIEAPQNWPLDGISLLPALRGESLQRGPIYSIFPHTVLATGNFANVWMRKGHWKLFRFFNTGPGQTDEYELYDLRSDIGETHNLAAHHPEVVQHMSAVLNEHLGESGTLLPRRNPNYDPAMRTGGFEMRKGALFVGNPDPDSAVFTAKDKRVTLRYHVKPGERGRSLVLDVMSNCAISAIAGAGEQPVFGPPARITPDVRRREIRLPLPVKVSEGILTLDFHLEQPGRTHLFNARLE